MSILHKYIKITKKDEKSGDGDYSKEQLNSHKKRQKREFMNSHIDTQQPTYKQEWLSLTGYSQKYNVSISTLRRRIRSGTITVKLEEGKYFIVDEQQSVPINQDQSVEIPENKNEQKQGSLIDKLLNTQQEPYQLLTEKDKKIEVLQTQISDFNTLVALLEKENFKLKNTLMALLEKENSKLKNQLEQEKKIEEWLNK